MSDEEPSTLPKIQNQFQKAKIILRSVSLRPENEKQFFKKQLRASCVGSTLKSALPTAPVTGGVAKPRRKKQSNPQSIRLSDRAQKELKTKAKVEGISIHQMARALLEAALFCEQSISVLPRARIESCENALHLWLVEHSRQGNNLNQLAVNSNKALLKGEVQPSVVNELKNIREIQKGILHALVRIQTWVNTVNRPVTIVDSEHGPR